ncbi:MAG: flagellar FlbD family protein [Candidatus Melainabacteria bacterium]|nr:flagellar FlbD family protein [Candidatus Melainabacteria bacterium]
MLGLTRLNGTQIWLNPELIVMLEATPDTVIRLSNGEVLVVEQTPQQIMEAFLAYQQSIRTGLRASL